MKLSSCPITPPTRSVPTQLEKSGQSFVDPYLALESDGPEREQWIGDQNARTRCHLDANPRREEIKQRLLELSKTTSADFQGARMKGPGYEVAWSKSKDQTSYVLSKFTPEDAKGAQVFDPNAWPKGETLGAYSLSPDNKFLAYGRVTNGMDVGKLEVMDIATGQVIKTIDGMRTTTAPVWAGADDKLYFSLKQGQRGFLSYDVSDNAVTVRGTGDLAFSGEVVERNGNALYTAQSKAYGKEVLVFANADGKETRGLIPDGETSFSSKGGNVFVQTNASAPGGRVFRVQMDQVETGTPKISELIPEIAGRTINSTVAVGTGVAVSFTENGMPGLAMYDLEGKKVQEITSAEPGVYSGLKGDREGNLLFSWSTLAQPRIDKKLNLETGEITVTNETKLPGFDPADYTVERKWYVSTDGTRVPMSLAHKKGITLDGTNPAHIYVYGGFGHTVTAGFSTDRVPFLEAGGVYAIAHVRGGGELGEDWHNQAKVEGRTKVYDDVAEASRFLSREGYSSPEHVSVGGASNGGLVSAVAVTRNPELFEAAVIGVGLTDMARFEDLGGHSWTQEYGTMGDAAQAKGLLSWSPYHNVHDNGSYPAVLITTGKSDDRVNPAHSYKFAARMQDVENGAHPAYLRVDEGLGHGGGSSSEARANTYADQWAFLLDELTDQDANTVA